MPAGPDRPIFVVGCGRSGTTVLYEVLCEHPDLAWFSNWSDRFPGHASVARLHRARWLGRPPKGSPARSRWRPHPVEGYATWDHCTGSLPGGLNRPLGAGDLTPDAADRARAVVAGHVRHQGARRFVNKNTRNARRIPYLAAAFPEASFVHVVRHPVDVARSLCEVAFWPDLPIWWAGDRTPTQLAGEGLDPLVVAGRFWSRELELVRRDLAAVPAGQRHEVRYDELLARPSDVVDGLLEALGIESSSEVAAAVGDRLGAGRGPTRRAGLDPVAEAAVWTEVADEAARWGYSPA